MRLIRVLGEVVVLGLLARTYEARRRDGFAALLLAEWKRTPGLPSRIRLMHKPPEGTPAALNGIFSAQILVEACANILVTRQYIIYKRTQCDGLE